VIQGRLRGFRRARMWLVFGAAAVVVLAVGVAKAAIPDSNDGEIHGCYQNQGQLRVVDAQAGDQCRASEVALVWNQEGPRGSDGTARRDGASGGNRAAGGHRAARSEQRVLALPRRSTASTGAQTSA
jgi:hypothetical protein